MINLKFLSFSISTIFFLVLSININAEELWGKDSDSRVSIVDNETYKKSCGSCHEAYSPGLLLPQSWEKIMMNLDKHFDKKVAVDQSAQTEILNYLLGNAAGRAKFALSSRLMVGLKDQQPIRITKLPFFVKKHEKTSGKLSNCSACHTRALEGSFDVKEVKLP